MPAICPFFPYAEEKPEIRCDRLAGKEEGAKQTWVAEFCKKRFKDCAYYFHLTKWLERIDGAMKEEDEE